jgi:hypothetical protein
MRNTRITIAHTMQTNAPLDMSLLYQYLFATVLHATIDTVLKHFKARVVCRHHQLEASSSTWLTVCVSISHTLSLSLSLSVCVCVCVCVCVRQSVCTSVCLPV